MGKDTVRRMKMANNRLYIVARGKRGEELARYCVAKRMGVPPWYNSGNAQEPFWEAIAEKFNDDPTLHLELEDEERNNYNGYDGFTLSCCAHSEMEREVREEIPPTHMSEKTVYRAMKLVLLTTSGATSITAIAFLLGAMPYWIPLTLFILMVALFIGFSHADLGETP